MTEKEKLKYQLFIGKVSEVIGIERTVELLKQSEEETNGMFDVYRSIIKMNTDRT